MILTKHSQKQLDIFKKELKKRDIEIDLYKCDIKDSFQEMVDVKNYLTIMHNDSKIPIQDRTKLFLEKLKELENIGEKHDLIVKKIHELKGKIDRDIDILISNIKTHVNLPDSEIKNYIIKFIES
jgi:hypothetical protein